MKKLASLLLILSFMTYAQDDLRLFKVNRKKECCTSGCPDFNFECCQGPRGKKGHRGKTGPRGATGATGAAASGISELSMNALTMTHSLSEGPVFIDEFFVYGVGSTGAPVPAWILHSSVVAPDWVGIHFNVPFDLDTTQPVNAVFYFVVPNSGGLSTGDQARLFLQSDYKNSGDLAGVESPATGFVTSTFSSDFTVTEPAASTPFDTNVIIIIVTVPVDPSFMTPGQWAFFELGRATPAANEYSFPIYVSNMCLQYTRVNS